MKIDLLNIVDESFSTYAAMTIQDRAIVDVRDAIKPAPRQCMYAQILEKITYKKPFKKSNKSVAAAMDHYYVHGDSSCYALLTRMAKNFAMRYPLEDFDGSYGTISGSNTEAASRYTEMRLGELGCLLYEGIEKDCIDKWFNNYDDTEQFPSVVPSLGYYNICNGSLGIATAISSSIPQFNVREVNEAMIKLLWNNNIDFDEIYCAPDFCTGATILNADEVKQSLKQGYGRSAIIRSTTTYDEKENCIYVTEIPYGVYTGTIIGQIKNLVDSGEIVGIKKIDDLSTRKANIKIALEKNVNVTKLIRQLYKLTSIQDSYTINMTMLDNGITPKVFGWREALLAHLAHEEQVYTKIHQYDLKKIDARLNIIEGILIAIANINEVVSLIKSSKNKDEAKAKLIERFGYNDEQVAAILKMTLSKLINLEIQSYNDEKNKLLTEKERINEILNNKDLLYKEIEAGLRRVADKYGDPRRTKLLNLDFKGEEENAEPIEKKELLIYYTNLGNLYTEESTTLIRSRRGTRGTKIKLANNEVVVKVLRDDNYSSLLAFSNKGLMYHIAASELPIGTKVNIAQLFSFAAGESPTAITTINPNNITPYFIFITKKGMIKKTASSEYDVKKKKAIKAINLKDDDEVVTVLFTDTEQVGILTSLGNYVIINTEDINAIGRISMGIKAIKLNDNDYVIDAKVVPHNAQYVVTLSATGLIKKTPISEFPLCSRATKGRKISAVKEGDKIIKHLILNAEYDIIIIEKKRSIKISSNEIQTLSRAALGVRSMKLKDNETFIDLLQENVE